MSLKTRLGRLELATGGKRNQAPFILEDFSKMNPIDALAHFDAFRVANASGRRIDSKQCCQIAHYGFGWSERRAPNVENTDADAE